MVGRDPQNLLDTAAQSSQSIGAVFLILGSAMIWFCLNVGSAKIFIIATFCVLIPGILFILLPHFIRARRDWAIIAALVLAVMSIVASLGLLIALIIYIVSGPHSRKIGALLVLVPLVSAALFSELSRQLLAGLGAVHTLADQKCRGFEPLNIGSIKSPDQD